MNKIKNMKNIFMKLVWMFIVLFCCTLIAIPKMNAGAVTQLVDENKTIKILEVEPGDIFKLTQTGGKSIDPGTYDDDKIVIPQNEKINGKVNGSNVQITHITMPEFISMVDEINGEYDVVVIGRENIKGQTVNSQEIKGLSSEYNYNTKYIDYTNPFSTNLDKSTFPSSYSEVEYYSENDLTDKRKQEIEKLIKSNQLVYIDNKIATDNYYETISWKKEDKTIKNTKLYSLYNSNNTNNFKKVNFDSVSLESIVNEYKDSSKNYSKRPCINEEDNLAANIDSNLNIKLNFKIYDNDTSNIKVKLYLDKNGDGLYTEDEYKANIVPNISNNSDGSKNCNISYKLDESLWGYVGWKIEVIKSVYNNIPIKTNVIGSNIISRSQSIPKKEIKVLQLFPSYWNDYSESDKPKEFQDNPAFQELCSTISEDYTISIVRTRIDKFEQQILNGTEMLKDKYNVVIIGFGKNDTIGSYNDQLSNKTIQEIKDYIKSGQSIIFTADTMSYQIQSSIEGKSTLNQSFRDTIGQARFKDPFNQDEVDVYGEKIQHMNLNEQGKYSAGMTARTWTGVGQNSNDNKYYARNINKSKVTSYPFDLNGKNIEVSKYDRVQVYQLNLEDEDVVPSYNIINDGNGAIDNGDSRNFYYSYSKGNITYCASLPDFDAWKPENKFPGDELKLFINTIIDTQKKSINNNPIISSQYIENNSQINILDKQTINLQSTAKDFSFTTQATDADGDKVKLEVYLDNGQTPYTTSNGLNPQGTIVPVNIPASKLQQAFYSGNKKINIKIIAIDEKGAQSEANYTLDLSNVVNVIHGVYKSMNSGKADIDTSNNLAFAIGAIVPFAANIDNLANKTISLEIDYPNCEWVGGINIWSNGQIVQTINPSNSKTYDLINYTQGYNNIVITYNVKLKTTQDKYTNTITVGGEPFNAYIRSSTFSLPDLF